MTKDTKGVRQVLEELYLSAAEAPYLENNPDLEKAETKLQEIMLGMLPELPHIQEFYKWCAEEEVDEETMYKIAGWLGTEIYMPHDFMEQNIRGGFNNG